jgi:hypothetical protein
MERGSLEPLWPAPAMGPGTPDNLHSLVAALSGDSPEMDASPTSEIPRIPREKSKNSVLV